ncbi:hypothetical protein CPJCM30710_14650 [Clostridium polyendosporum]|uniref:DUF2933 domain-containing protein n=1 Tax=Clostridium polyendosporum TaxID=69208 RepID=A0A919VE63_9CLOT|nr:hypothetical protein [Clostridium polyendosporum]GIM28799.1 hypothetical protein CPJCM30710_14650 [Clostridium polyendosporum]
MNCHGKNNEKRGTHNHSHSPLKHILHMVICCGLPIVIVGLLPLITKFSPSTGSVITTILPFLCPLMMIAMLPMMFRGNKKANCCDNTKNHNSNNKAPELDQSAE